MKLALRIEVSTLRGTRDGVPRLLDALGRHGAGASFFFNLGPDRSGRALARGYARDWLPRPPRSPVWRHYGGGALARGLVWPSPDLGAACAAIMRGVQDAGFEAAIQAWDRCGWLAGIEGAGSEHTAEQFRLATERFRSIFDQAPLAHGAPGWRINRHGLRLTQRLGFAYSSDTRGQCPFIPLWDAEIVACPQIPTTLPTLDELACERGTTPEQAVERLLAMSGNDALQVCTVRAELEGGRLLPQFEALLAGWKAAGRTVTALREVAADLDLAGLPRHAVVTGSVPGRPGSVLMQGPEFLA